MDKNTYLENNLSRNQLCRYNIPPNHRPMRHQYLSNIATPELGMISSRNKGTLAESYIAKGATKLSQSN